MGTITIPKISKEDTIDQQQPLVKRPGVTVRDVDIAFKQQTTLKQKERSNLFKGVGLAISLALVILAFEWKSYEQEELVQLGALDAEFEEILDIPITNQEPPPPPTEVTSPPQIIEVPDEEEIEEDIDVNLDVEVTEETAIEEVVFEETPEEEVSDEIFEVVEENATPVGGMQDFYQYFAKELVYPVIARKAGVEGKVYIQFVVDKSGNVSQVKVVKGLGHGCDEEAIRVVKKGPKWNPAKQRGRPVNSRVTLPLIFKLS